jgi:hypothetical protein
VHFIGTVKRGYLRSALAGLLLAACGGGVSTTEVSGHADGATPSPALDGGGNTNDGESDSASDAPDDDSMAPGGDAAPEDANDATLSDATVAASDSGNDADAGSDATADALPDAPDDVTIEAPPDAADAASPDATLPPDSGEDAAPSCSLVVCNGTCVDTTSDGDNCGTCGTTCGSGALCNASKCVPNTVALLPFDVVDAEYSAALDRVVIVSASPPALHVLNPFTNAYVSVALASTPVAVSVGPDGLHAAVGHDHALTYLDLSGPSIVGTYVVPYPVGDLALAGNGYIYGIASSDQWVGMHIFGLGSQLDTWDQSATIYAGSKLKLASGGAMLYVAVNSGPSEINAYDITTGLDRGAGSSQEIIGADAEGALWMSADGGRIFTRSGQVFAVTPPATSTAQATFSLETTLPDLGPGSFVPVTYADATASEVAVITGATEQLDPGPILGSELATFDATTLAFLGAIPMPRVSWPGTSTSFPASGAFVFHSADGTHRFVLVESFIQVPPYPYAMGITEL